MSAFNGAVGGTGAAAAAAGPALGSTALFGVDVTAWPHWRNWSLEIWGSGAAVKGGIAGGGGWLTSGEVPGAGLLREALCDDILN